jgi:1,4-alpha-glucan branching enzyme
MPRLRSILRLSPIVVAPLFATSTALALEIGFKAEDFPGVNIAAAHIAGPFNEWKPDATAFSEKEGTYTVDLPLADGEWPYKLVLTTKEGEVRWDLDPGNATYKPDGLGGFNSAIHVLEGAKVSPPASYELFEWRDDAAKTVSVCGEFCQWNTQYLYLRKAKDGIWRAHVQLERPFEYKFVIDNEHWMTEEPNDDVGFAGSDSNNVRLPRGADPAKEQSVPVTANEEPELPEHLKAEK